MMTSRQLCTSLGNEFHNFSAATLSSDLNTSKTIINMIQTHLLKQSYTYDSGELFKCFNRFRWKEIVESLIICMIYGSTTIVIRHFILVKLSRKHVFTSPYQHPSVARTSVCDLHRRGQNSPIHLLNEQDSGKEKDITL